MQAYRNARRELKKGIKEATYKYKQRLEALFNNSNSCSMWRGIKVITDYNGRSSHISNDPCLPDALNCFFARFDNQNDNGAYSEVKKNDGQAIVLKHHQVRSTLRMIDINKASGPDSVSGRTLKNMCRSAGGSVYKHFQPLTTTSCCSYMSEVDNHHPCTKEKCSGML